MTLMDLVTLGKMINDNIIIIASALLIIIPAIVYTIDYNSKYNNIEYRKTVSDGMPIIRVGYNIFQPNKKKQISNRFKVGSNISTEKQPIIITELFGTRKTDDGWISIGREFIFCYTNKIEQEKQNIQINAGKGSQVNYVGRDNHGKQENTSTYNNNDLIRTIQNDDNITNVDKIFMEYIINKINSNEEIKHKEAEEAIDVFNKYTTIASSVISIINFLSII